MRRSGDFLHRRGGPGLDLFLLPTTRFKTVQASLHLFQPLRPRTASGLSLAASVLRQGTEAHPTRALLQAEEDGLYGADLALDTGRIGEAHILMTGLEIPADRFTGDPRGVAKGLDLLAELLARPVTERGGLKPAWVRQERRHLKEAIAAARNDKPGWAAARCLRAACAGEPYRTGRYGTPEDLDAWTPRELLEFWRASLERLPATLYAVGAFDPDRMADRLSRLLEGARGGRPLPMPPGGFRTARPRRPRRILERERVGQSRLCLAFRTNTAWDDPRFTGLVLAANVLGGGSHSKLFREVREKASLAYDPFASLDRTKGLLLVTAGVDEAKRGKAEAILMRQVEDVRAGRISRSEWTESKRVVVNRVRSAWDSPARLVSHHTEGWLNGAPRGIPEVLEAVRRCRPEDAAAAASRWALDVTYALAPARRGGA